MKTVPPQGDGLTTFILTIIMLVLCVPTVALRFWVRVKIKALGLDDWLMGLGMAMTVAWSALLITYCFSGGGYRPGQDAITSDLETRALKYYFICQAFYCLTTIPIKLSICVALLRICNTRFVFKWALWAIISLTIIAGVGSCLGIIFSCNPSSAFWDGMGTCYPAVNTAAAYFISGCSIVTDFGLAVLPWILLWNLQMKRAIKVSVAIILALAAFASTATLVRLRYLLALLDSSTFLFTSVKIAIWTVVELGIGIFAGSLPHLRPLLRYIPFLSEHSSRHSDATLASHGRGRPTQAPVRMDTFKHTTYVEAGRVKRNLGDGESEEHILEERDRLGRKVSVRNQTAHTVDHLHGQRAGIR